MKFFLMFFDFFIPCVYILKKCYKSKKGFVIDHVALFSFGFVFYWVIPFIIGEMKFTGLINSWSVLYNTIENKTIVSYLFQILVIYLAFILSQELPIKNKKENFLFNYSQKTFDIWMIIVLLIDFFLFVTARNILFKGYQRNMENNAIVGMMSAISLIIFSLYTMYSVKNKSGSFKNDFKNKYMIFFAINSVLLLSTGGRMYVVIPLAALFVIYTNYYKPIKIKKLFPLILCIVAIFAIWGLARVGSAMNFFDAFSVILAEPAYTAFSLFDFLAQNKIKLFNFPISLLTGFINLIPSILLPNKANYIISFENLGYSIFSPLGALNSYVSFMINFGFLGSVIFIYILFRLIKKLRYSKGELNILIYSFLSADICFTFFRDPFQVSLIKNMLEFSIIIPFGIVCFNTVLSHGKIYIHKK